MELSFYRAIFFISLPIWSPFLYTFLSMCFIQELSLYFLFSFFVFVEKFEYEHEIEM